MESLLIIKLHHCHCRETFVKLVCDQNVPIIKSFVTTTGDSRITLQYVNEKAN